MHKDRRNFLGGLGAVSLFPTIGVGTAAAQRPNSQSVPDFPDMRNFRTGDLLWPKRKRAVVTPQPRSAGPKPVDDRPEWEAARAQLLANPLAAGLSPEVAERLKTMTYAEFEREYFSLSTRDAPSTGAPAARGTLPGPISVGHVGMIGVESNGGAFIVEAIPSWRGSPHKGVVRLPYAEWLGGYTNIQVWHGRLRGVDAEAGRRLLDIASQQIGKPYDFFNFNLDDDSGFYCSKLIWMSAWRGLQLAIDDDPNPIRGTRFPPWFSPKALISVRHVEILHSPGEY